MGVLDSVVSFIRHPVDFIQQAVCESAPRGNACGTLTALASAMDGQQARTLSASAFHPEALPQAPRAPGGSHIVEHSIFTPIRTELLFQQIERLEVQELKLPEIGILCLFGTDCGSSHSQRAEASAREVSTGCHLQHAEQHPLLEEIHTLPTAIRRH